MALNDDEVQVRRMLADYAADQPPDPPDRYRAVRQRLSRHRRNRSAQVLALALAVTGAGLGISLPSGGSGSGSGHGPVTIRGILEVSGGSKYFRTACPPPFPSDTTGNTMVTVQGPSGEVVARAKLGRGSARAAGISCVYPFTLKRVPAESRYLVSAGNAAAAAWFTAGQVRGPIVLRFPPPARTPLASLTGSDTAAGDGFGQSLAASSSVIVVGAPGHARSAGRVYVFTLGASGWRQYAELAGSDTAPGDYFGDSVAMSGGSIVVGAPGHARSAGRVYVFTQAADGWRQSAELTGSDTAAGDNFGSSVGASGGTIVVGASGAAINRQQSSHVRAYAFSRTSGSWIQSAEMTGFTTSYSDISVAVSGATIVVAVSGAPYVVASGRASYINGQAYVYLKTAGGWRRAARLDAPGPGYWLTAAMSATTIVITSQHNGCGTGQADVLTRAGRAWKLAATFTPAVCGPSPAVSGSAVAIGSNGAAYVYTQTTGRWHQSAVLADPNHLTKSPTFGSPIAISGETAVVADRRGIVYLYRL